MPRLDQTGPNGAGPMTGRAAGPCNTNSTMNGGMGRRGAGRGAGCGMGRRMGAGNQPNIDQQNELADIQKRLDALEQQ